MFLLVQNQLEGVQSYAVDGAEPTLEWESSSDEEVDPQREVLYDRTEDNQEAWSDGGASDEQVDNDDMDALR